MVDRKVWPTALAAILLLIARPLWGVEISVEGGPVEPGFNSGTFAYIHARVHGLTGQPKRYVVFAEIQYYGTTATTSVELDRLPETTPGVEEFQAGWPIPPQAPTGLYTLSLHVDDRIDHVAGVTKKVHGFVVYKKLVRISRVTLDRTIYNVGDPIKCELSLENLSDTDLKGLRVEFSNANYPWISLYSQGGHENPDLAIRLMRDHLDIPAGTAVTIPMIAAGTATFLQGKQRDVMGAGFAVRNQKVPPPEVDTYTVALWNADRTRLYDMQFTPQAIVRSWDRDLPKPYSTNFLHPYNFLIDFTRYREFYAAGQTSAATQLDHSHTLYRPGDTVKIAATLKNPWGEAWSGVSLQARIADLRGREAYTGTLASGIDLPPGASKEVSADAWSIPATAAPGTYNVELTLSGSGIKYDARATSDIAINELPPSLLVICAHEDDDQAYAGLMRAAVEVQDSRAPAALSRPAMWGRASGTSTRPAVPTRRTSSALSVWRKPPKCLSTWASRATTSSISVCPTVARGPSGLSTKILPILSCRFISPAITRPTKMSTSPTCRLPATPWWGDSTDHHQSSSRHDRAYRSR